jgi:hypothetical protein
MAIPGNPVGKRREFAAAASSRPRELLRAVERAFGSERDAKSRDSELQAEGLSLREIVKDIPPVFGESCSEPNGP